MARTPKLWRKKRANGKFVGSFHATIDGSDVNLGTSDAEEARKRLVAALKKRKRNFPNELDEAAEAVDGAPPAAPPLLTTPPAPQAHTASPPIVPDDIIPPARQLPPAPSADEVRAEAEATNAAAADVGGGSGGAANDNAMPPISGDVLEAMVENGALVIVDLQLQLQAYIIKRKLGRVAGEIAPDSPLRKAAAQAWVAQLKIWIPDFDFLPPWGLALLLPIVCVPQQLATSQPVPPENQQEKPADPPVQEAA